MKFIHLGLLGLLCVVHVNAHEDYCDSYHECDKGYTCVNNQCQAIPNYCEVKSDCSDGFACTNNQCVSIENYCRYDSQCDAGYYCYKNECTHELPTYIPPTQTPQINPVPLEKTVEKNYAELFVNNQDNDANQTSEIIIENEEEALVFQEMDECGNVYDGYGNLIWGSGECALDSETNTVSSNLNLVLNDKDLPKQTEDTSLMPTPDFKDYQPNQSKQTQEKADNDVYNLEVSKGNYYLVLIVLTILSLILLYVVYGKTKKKT